MSNWRRALPFFGASMLAHLILLAPLPVFGPIGGELRDPLQERRSEALLWLIEVEASAPDERERVSFTELPRPLVAERPMTREPVEAPALERSISRESIPEALPEPEPEPSRSPESREIRQPEPPPPQKPLQELAPQRGATLASSAGSSPDEPDEPLESAPDGATRRVSAEAISVETVGDSLTTPSRTPPLTSASELPGLVPAAEEGDAASLSAPELAELASPVPSETPAAHSFLESFIDVDDEHPHEASEKGDVRLHDDGTGKVGLKTSLPSEADLEIERPSGRKALPLQEALPSNDPPGRNRIAGSPPGQGRGSDRLGASREGESQEAEEAVEAEAIRAPIFVPPRVKSKVAPSYPSRARRQGAEGSVVLQVDVDENGLSTGAKVLQSSGRKDLDAAALEAVWKWQFYPAQEDEQPVSGRVEVTVVFRLN